MRTARPRFLRRCAPRHLPLLTVGGFRFLLAYREHELPGLARAGKLEHLDLGRRIVIAVRGEAIIDRIVGDQGRSGSRQECGLAHISTY